MIADAGMLGSDALAPDGGVLRVSRDGDLEAYTLAIVALPRGELDLVAGRFLVAVIITDPDGRPSPSPRTLQLLYQLTPAEARVAAGLVSGATLQQLADQFEVSIETVRTQLKAIYAKTKTRRQSELVQLLSRVPKPA